MTPRFRSPVCLFAVPGFYFYTQNLYPELMDPLHATLEEFAADGYTHVEANCPRCRVIRLRPIDQLPKISIGAYA